MHRRKRKLKWVGSEFEPLQSPHHHTTTVFTTLPLTSTDNTISATSQSRSTVSLLTATHVATMNQQFGAAPGGGRACYNCECASSSILPLLDCRTSTSISMPQLDWQSLAPDPFATTLRRNHSPKSIFLRLEMPRPEMLTVQRR